MSRQIEPRTDAASVFEHIEELMDRILASQKDDIEKSLIEKILKEKEEAQVRIRAAEAEFTNVRRVMEENRVVMSELQGAAQRIRCEIRGHLDRAAEHQKSVEGSLVQAAEELSKIGPLSEEMARIRRRAEEHLDFLRRHLEEHFGVKTEFPTTIEPEEMHPDWTLEMSKVKQVLELLSPGNGNPAEKERTAEATAPASEEIPVDLPAEPAEIPAPAEELVEEAAAEEPQPEPQMAEGHEDIEGLIASLAKYRRTEAVANGTEFAYFQNNGQMIVDGEALIAAMERIYHDARELHVQVGQTESIKELFLIKQDILNQQEILRKIFYRAVKFCEKEDGCLPAHITDTITSQTIKDILERLTMANWSNPSDFEAFQADAAMLKSAFLAKTAPLGEYLKSVLDQVEGRN